MWSFHTKCQPFFCIHLVHLGDQLLISSHWKCWPLDCWYINCKVSSMFYINRNITNLNKIAFDRCLVNTIIHYKGELIVWSFHTKCQPFFCIQLVHLGDQLLISSHWKCWPLDCWYINCKVSSMFYINRNITNLNKIAFDRCLVNTIIHYWRCLFFIIINIFRHLELKILAKNEVSILLVSL